MSRSKPRILFQLTGSIACFKACQAISELVKSGCDVQVIASTGALKFVGEATLEGLTGKPILSDLYERGHAMDHVHLARDCDVLVICPATANTINRLAAGLADDLIGAVFLAAERKKPYLVFPAMNVQMLHHPATQQSLKSLEAWGIQILETGTGALACGEAGEGRLLEPAQIVKTILSATKFRMTRSGSASDPITGSGAQNQGRQGRLLITYGGTVEPIDDVRVITNRSTGATGSAIADFFSCAGWQTTVLSAQEARNPTVTPTHLHSFVTTADLETMLMSQLKDESFDVIIHTAAVSDYSLLKHQGKLSSEADVLTLSLKRNPKLVDNIKIWSKNPSVRLIAFKLTSGLNEDAIRDSVHNLFEHSPADFIVHNDLSNLEIRTIFSREAGCLRQVHSTPALSQALLDLCTEEVGI